MAQRVLTRVHSLRERLDATLDAHRNEILLFLSRYGLTAMFSLFVIFVWYVSQA